MIKLRDIYNAIKEGTNSTDMTTADQLWPFATKASYAKSWEASRLNKVFDKSLEGMIRHPNSDLSSIVNGDDVSDIKSQLAATSNSDGTNKNVLPDWTKIDDLDDTKFNTPTITDDPTKDPQKGKLVKK